MSATGGAGRAGRAGVAGVAGVAGRVTVAGADFDLLTHEELIQRVADAIRLGEGGTIMTPNIDICQRIAKDERSRELVASASLVVPDGMPLLWAARLAGRPLTERITGADLIFSLCAAARANGWPVHLVGGRPGQPGQYGQYGRPSVAQLAASRLAELYPGLVVSGAYSPPERFDAVSDDIDLLRKELIDAEPKVVFAGLGFPKQEELIARLRPDLPGTWFVGCGAAIPYAAGELRRAPAWLQRLGLEWAYRLASEPRRLTGRYLGRDLPFAAALLLTSLKHRTRRPGT
jgi:exopolysaccharide biosynthesis WecB/TagA/CpsF family protein